MNEIKAKDLIEIANAADGQISRFERDQEMKAIGYLQAIEKAKVLADCLAKLVHENGDIEMVKISLAKWEKEK